MKVDVKIWLNREEDEQGRPAVFTRFGHGESKYREGDHLEHVITLQVEGDDAYAILNHAYAMTNRGSGEFVGDDVYPQRSLSVGDVVEILGLRWSVEGVGFQQLGGAA